jgi:hypothetical protein
LLSLLAGARLTVDASLGIERPAVASYFVFF